MDSTLVNNFWVNAENPLKVIVQEMVDCHPDVFIWGDFIANKSILDCNGDEQISKHDLCRFNSHFHEAVSEHIDTLKGLVDNKETKAKISYTNSHKHPVTAAQYNFFQFFLNALDALIIDGEIYSYSYFKNNIVRGPYDQYIDEITESQEQYD